MAAEDQSLRWPAYCPSTTHLRGPHPSFTRLMCDQIMDEVLAVLPSVDESKGSRIRAMRLPALVAFMVPHSTSHDRLVILCKWLTCLLLFGNLFEYPWLSQGEALRLGRGLDSLPRDLRLLATEGPLASDKNTQPQYVQYMRGIFAEMFRLSPRREQFLRAADYLERAITAMHARKHGPSRACSDDLEQWKRSRVDSTGMFMLFHWMEFALGLYIPDSVWDDPTVQLLMDEACLQIGVVHDLYALPKHILMNDCRVDTESMNCVAWLMRGTGESLQEAVDRCWDYIHHLDDSVVHAAIVVKSRFRQDKAISQAVDAIVYSLQGSWAYGIRSSQYWLKLLHPCQPALQSERFTLAPSDEKPQPLVVSNEVDDKGDPARTGC
ncbi:terpenoid synthase [Aspergillus fijiensis CBS 313.89]|uniref:Terpenoid synthase n=1 Tax=Aspergillus fijiensis CBS 313.89 TaxID=1448319 RepID=A0A8G1RUT7_9EURO|nr:terpenoid synthase [Aspergillus fijiensis CBS 313.89]RAK79303.1 terpenoid synthase [Aspergillus fijiensis CBS 313.89]